MMAGYNDSEGPYTTGGAGFKTHLSHITDITNKFDKDVTPATDDALRWDGTVFRPKIGTPHVDVSSWVDTTGTTDVGGSVWANMLANTPTGSCYNIPPNSKLKISTTIKVPGSAASIEIKGRGPRSYNEADSGVVGALFVADAGVTAFQFGNDAPSTVAYRGPVLRNFTIREAGDAQTAVAIDIRATVNWTIRDINIRGFATGVKADSYTYDASWGILDHPSFYKVGRCFWALGSSFTAVGGNYSTDGWAFYIEPKGSVTSTAKLLGVKIDATGTYEVGGGVYTEGAHLEAHGCGIELNTTNTQFGYKMISDTGKHADSGRANKIMGGGVSATGGTGHTAVSVGAGCSKTQVFCLEVIGGSTTKLVDAGDRTVSWFAGDPLSINRSVGEYILKLSDGQATPADLLGITAGASTAAHLTVLKAASQLRVRLAGTTTSDRFVVQDSAALDLFRVEGAGAIRFGQVASTTTAPAAGGAGALPATPAGYMTINVNGTNRQIPYY